MSIEGSAFTLEPESQTDTNSLWFGGSQAWVKQYRGAFPSVPGLPTVGEHGPEFSPQKPSPADHEAILNCGCSVFFPVPPMEGESLFCWKHDDWYKSRPAEVKEKPLGEYTVKCHTCPRESKYTSSNRVYTAAKRHAYGKNGNKNPPHEVSIGRVVGTGIQWKRYERKKK